MALHCGWLAFLGSGLPRPVSQLMVGPALVFLSPWTHLFVASTYHACPLSTRALQACMSSGEPAPGEPVCLGGAGSRRAVYHLLGKVYLGHEVEAGV